jgi:porin
LPVSESRSGLSPLLALPSGCAGPDARNRENVYLEGGINWQGLIAGRSNDRSGLAIAHARTSNALRRLGAETATMTGMPNNIRQHETVIEVTYLY